MYKIMTPGPTQVAENVRLARSKECTNPDLDTDFVEFYKETCEEISRLLHTENETLILGGEGILGLEAACASMTEPGDRVLVLDNGIYGRGFADFVSMYGANRNSIPEITARLSMCRNWKTFLRIIMITNMQRLSMEIHPAVCSMIFPLSAHCSKNMAL